MLTAGRFSPPLFLQSLSPPMRRRRKAGRRGRSKLIVPTSAGSATDIMARPMANDVQSAVGGTIVVENLGGSSGIPAHQAVARAEPDGYTFMFTIRRAWPSTR